MSYQITLHKMNSSNTVEQKLECTAETQWSAIELFDCITRGVRGYYKCWVVNLDTDVIVRESSLTKAS